MEEIKAPKKERKFFRAMGDIGLALFRELVLGIGKKVINKVGNKRQGLVIAAILFASVTACAQYPGTNNKMRLGFQTTGDGLLYRGRASDTVSIKSSGLNNAYHIHDTVNNVLLSFIKTKGGWVFNNSDTVIVNNTTDTASLSNRIDLKLNLSDTAEMLLPYFKDVDTTSLNLTSRFASKLNLSDTAFMLTNYIKSKVNLEEQVTSTLQIANGGTSAITAEGARATLGGTTIGQSMFMLPNLNAITFPRFNANNTVSALNAADFRTAIGAGTGTGTVTSVSGSGAITSTGGAAPVIGVAVADFGISGIVNSSGIQQFSGDKQFQGNTTFNGRALFKDYTYVATRLAGLSSTDRFATVTIGSGLDLSSGTLIATGGTGTVTNVSAGSPANGLSVASGTTTPVISMALAASGTIGVVSATTQVFSGNKTFQGLIGMNKALQRPVGYITGSSASVTTASTWVIVNHAGTVTLTFPSASASTGTEFHIKTITNNTVISASSNIVPIAGGSASTSILSATAGKYVTLVSDGSNWVIMQAN